MITIDQIKKELLEGKSVDIYFKRYQPIGDKKELQELLFKNNFSWSSGQRVAHFPLNNGEFGSITCFYNNNKGFYMLASYYTDRRNHGYFYDEIIREHEEYCIDGKFNELMNDL